MPIGALNGALHKKWIPSAPQSVPELSAFSSVVEMCLKDLSIVLCATK